MATQFSHVVLACSLGVALKPREAPIRLWVLGATCSILPDVDVLGFWMGVPYEHPLGHRGVTHSLVFAVALSLVVVGTFFRGEQWVASRRRLFTYFVLATASHGVLDAMTNGGLGVAFFAPFSDTRYFFPFRPIQVSPLSLTGMFTVEGVTIVANEIVWIWLPSFLFASGFYLGRRRRSLSGTPAGS